MDHGSVLNNVLSTQWLKIQIIQCYAFAVVFNAGMIMEA